MGASATRMHGRAWPNEGRGQFWPFLALCLNLGLGGRVHRRSLHMYADSYEFTEGIFPGKIGISKTVLSLRRTRRNRGHLPPPMRALSPVLPPSFSPPPLPRAEHWATARSCGARQGANSKRCEASAARKRASERTKWRHAQARRAAQRLPARRQHLRGN